MKIVVQRSKNSSVVVAEKVVGAIDFGLVLLVCFEKDDLAKDKKSLLEKASTKIISLRIFEDENEKMNKSILDTGGKILAISQFTLSWDGQKGNRPSFDQSMDPANAEIYFAEFIELLKKNVHVQTGIFGASMQVNIINDGPVTILLSF